MTTVYILTFNKTKEKHDFTSVIAIFAEFDYEKLHIKYRTLNNHKFSEGNYENYYITVERVYAKSKQDIERTNLKTEE